MQCGEPYIGSTMKSLKSQASQHNGISSRTGLQIKTSHSRIKDHANKRYRKTQDFYIRPINLGIILGGTIYKP